MSISDWLNLLPKLLNYPLDFFFSPFKHIWNEKLFENPKIKRNVRNSNFLWNLVRLQGIHLKIESNYSKCRLRTPPENKIQEKRGKTQKSFHKKEKFLTTFFLVVIYDCLFSCVLIFLVLRQYKKCVAHNFFWFSFWSCAQFTSCF